MNNTAENIIFTFSGIVIIVISIITLEVWNIPATIIVPLIIGMLIGAFGTIVVVGLILMKPDNQSWIDWFVNGPPKPSEWEADNSGNNV